MTITPLAVNILRDHLSVIGIVQNPLGYDFAVRFAPDVRVTEDLVRDTWQASPRSFRDYDSDASCFVTF